MMVFTDNDLKRLKEEMKDRNCVGYAKITIPLFEALLARLATAERYASYVAPIESKGMELRNAWHESAGKTQPLISDFKHSDNCWCKAAGK